jgi:hypothetical protein
VRRVCAGAQSVTRTSRYPRASRYPWSQARRVVLRPAAPVPPVGRVPVSGPSAPRRPRQSLSERESERVRGESAQPPSSLLSSAGACEPGAPVCCRLSTAVSWAPMSPAPIRRPCPPPPSGAHVPRPHQAPMSPAPIRRPCPAPPSAPADKRHWTGREEEREEIRGGDERGAGEGRGRGGAGGVASCRQPCSPQYLA